MILLKGWNNYSKNIQPSLHLVVSEETKMFLKKLSLSRGWYFNCLTIVSESPSSDDRRTKLILHGFGSRWASVPNLVILKKKQKF